MTSTNAQKNSLFPVYFRCPMGKNVAKQSQNQQYDSHLFSCEHFLLQKRFTPKQDTES